MTLAFNMVCMWCGSHNTSEVPIPSKTSTMEATCRSCGKVMIEFVSEVKQ